MTKQLKRLWLELLELIFPDKTSDWSVERRRAYDAWKRKVNKL